MKLLIIEGTDNVGKDSVIKSLLKLYPNNKVIHCDKPLSKDPDEAMKELAKLFFTIGADNMSDFVANKYDLVIHNRSWYGEYVYGCMYRNNNPEQVIKMVNHIESYLILVIGLENICYVTLLSDNLDFLVKHDDGLSISNAKQELIKLETERFKEIYNESLLENKHIIYVNNGVDFRHHDDILYDIVKNLNM